MRDWYAQRVAEQRGHGEPIGDAADETGFRGGLQQAGPPARRQQIARQCQHCHQGQEAGCEGTEAAQGPASQNVGVNSVIAAVFSR